MPILIRLDPPQPLRRRAFTRLHVARLAIALLIGSSSSFVCAQTAATVTSFQNEPLAATPGYVRFGAPITVSARVLPADATGTITFSLDGVALQTVPLTRQTLGDYVAFGDSITWAGYIGDPNLRYPAILGNSLSLTTIDYAAGGYTACDVLPLEAMPYNITNVPAYNPLYSLMIGSSDITYFGSGSHEPVFNLCHQAELAWLGVPRPNKVLVGDPGESITSGTWSTNLVGYAPCCLNTLSTSSPGSSAQFQVQSSGNPIYLWYGIQTAANSTFTVTVDGGAQTFHVPLTQYSDLGITLSSYGYLRIPIAAGSHRLTVVAGSGPVTLLGAGSAPSSGKVPTILVSDIPNQIDGDTVSIAAYTADVEANRALLIADGLDIRQVITQQTMLATPAEMVDNKHPNSVGLAELAQAFAVPITTAHPANDTVDVATASLALPTLSIGAHQVDMAYSGDAKYPPSSAATVNYGIYDGSSTTTLTSDAQTDTTLSPVSLTANVSSNDLGEVDFLDTTASGTTKLGTIWLNQPTANPLTLVVPGLPAGQHTVTASYLGDYHFNGAASPSIQISVFAVATSTTLSAPGTRYLAGTTIPLTATVTPSSATGNVTFFDGTTSLGQAALVSGTASLALSNLGPGVHSLTASFPSTTVCNGSQSPPLSIEIDRNTSSIALSATPNATAYGTPITLTAAVSPAAATGAISLLDSFVPLGATQATTQTLAILPQSSGSFTASALAPGTHTVTAAYAGDPNDSAATSLPVSLQVSQDASTTTLGALPSAIGYGTVLQLSAAVAPAASTGSVTFTDSVAGVLAQVPLANGTAGFSTSSLAPGIHFVSASYSGDTYRSSSASSASTTTVSPLTSSIFITQPLATLYAGNPLTLAATLSPSTATGTVIFRDATSGVLGSATVGKGSATLVLANPAGGAYSISAAYSGDTYDAASTSAPISLQVLLNATATTLAASANSSPAAAPIVLTASVSPASATGTVTFFDGATPIASIALASGTASTTVANLAAGSHTLHASYGGNAIAAMSTSPSVTETITADATSTMLTLAQASVVAGSTASANVHVGSAYTVPSGTVSLRSGSTVLASAPLANGTTGNAYATLTFNSAALGLGASSLVASYAGDNADQPSDSSAVSVTETVLPIPTTLALTLSASNAPAQGIITLSATVSATSTPTGSVTFLSNGTAIATVQLSAGSASTTFTPSAVGSYTLTATYTPTGLFAASSAAPQTLTVTPPVTLSLTPNTISAARGSSESANLEITPNFGFTGSIQTQCQTSATWIACALTAPATISGPVGVPVKITVAQNTSALVFGKSAAFSILAMLLPLLIRRRRRARFTLLATGIAAATFMTACGGSPYALATGPQSATITVTGAGSVTTTTLTIDITQ